MGFAIGAVLAVVVAIFARMTGLDRGRVFYSTVLIVVGHYYVLFAVVGGSVQALALELMVMSGFALVAVAGLQTNMWLVVAGLAGHGVFDLFHGGLIENAGVPVWWPSFCGAYDVVAAGVLALMAWHPRLSQRVFARA